METRNTIYFIANAFRIIYHNFMTLYRRINVAIVDDQFEFRNLCKETLLNLGFGQIGSFSSLQELNQSDFPADLIVCDICLQNQHLAMDQISSVPGQIPVLWVSSYPAYALEGFCPQALGFVDKAHLKNDLPKAISKAIRALEKIPAVSLKTYYDTLSIPTFRIEMICIEQSNLYLHLFHHAKPICLTESSLGHCMEKLDSHLFFHAGRNAIINLSGIHSVDEDLHQIRMECGKKVQIPRRKWKEFMEKYIWSY